MDLDLVPETVEELSLDMTLRTTILSRLLLSKVVWEAVGRGPCLEFILGSRTLRSTPSFEGPWVGIRQIYPNTLSSISNEYHRKLLHFEKKSKLQPLDKYLYVSFLQVSNQVFQVG